MDRKVIIVSAPSGAGKTTLIKHLLTNLPILEFSVSATSRKMREGEMHGRDYYFLTPDGFRAKLAKGEFVEWEEVYQDQFYGTLKSELDRIWDKDHFVLFDVDVKGGINLKKIFGSNAFSVFIMPPSVDELRRRLEARQTETPESIAKRVARAEFEIELSEHFDCAVVNEKVEIAQKELFEHIVRFLR